MRLVWLELELHRQKIPQGRQAGPSAAPYRLENCEPVLRLL